ncbi:hypothetical protein [Candidatus Jidaibacter acanthamoebae]|nr:hypothetical protein [Candidatus Jidaibacter acanthamoeba]
MKTFTNVDWSKFITLSEEINPGEQLNLFKNLLKDCKEIDLYGIELDFAKMILLSEAITDSISLESIFLTSLALDRADDSFGIKVLAEAMATIPKLKQISWLQCRLIDKEAVYIANVLSSKNNIHFFNMSQNSISDSGAIYIINAFKNHRNCKLCLIGNQIRYSDEFLQAVSEEEILPKLSLSIKDTHFATIEDGETSNIIKILSSSKICSLDLFLDVNNKAFYEITSKALQKNRFLRNLSLSGVNYRNVWLFEYVNIIKIIKHNSFLEAIELYINERTISICSLINIVRSLKENHSLKYFYLGYSGKSIQFLLPFLADSIVNNDSLEILNLSWWKLNNDSIPYILEILENNSRITSIDLCNNKIDNEGALKLLEVIQKKAYIIDLWLKGNEISDNMLEKINTTLNNNKLIFEAHCEAVEKNNFKYFNKFNLSNIKSFLSALNNRIRLCLPEEYERYLKIKEGVLNYAKGNGYFSLHGIAPKTIGELYYLNKLGTLQDLPVEIIIYILSFLKLEDVNLSTEGMPQAFPLTLTSLHNICITDNQSNFSGKSAHDSSYNKREYEADNEEDREEEQNYKRRKTDKTFEEEILDLEKELFAEEEQIFSPNLPNLISDDEDEILLLEEETEISGSTGTIAYGENNPAAIIPRLPDSPNFLDRINNEEKNERYR